MNNERHPVLIANSEMRTSANLPLTHSEGYAEGVTFNYGFINSAEQPTDREQKVRAWYALRGTQIEYWNVSSENVTCVELNGTQNSSGIKQRIMFYEDESLYQDEESNLQQSYLYGAGFYLVTWQERGRRGDDGKAVTDTYKVWVSVGDPSNPSSQLIASREIDGTDTTISEWKNRCMLVRINRAHEFNETNEDLWIAMECSEQSTFGALIKDVKIHAIELKAEVPTQYGIDGNIFPVVAQENTSSAEDPDLVGTKNPDSIAWITWQGGRNEQLYINEEDDNYSSPLMPKLTLHIQGLDASRYSWETRMDVTYERPEVKGASAEEKIEINKVIERDTIHIPADSESFQQINDSKWDIFANDDWKNEVSYGFFGGAASINFIIYENQDIPATDESDNRHQEHGVYNFRIAGQNPNDSVCERYIKDLLAKEYTETLSGMSWCIPAIAKHESFGYGGEATYYPLILGNRSGALYNQFKANGGHGTHIKGKEGIPLHSPDSEGAGGYGIFQVTGSTKGTKIAIPRNQIWNWQENIKAAFIIILSKYVNQVGFMERQKSQQNEEAEAKTLHVYKAKNSSPGTGAAYEFDIEDGTERTMVHLCAVRLYNGGSRPPESYKEPEPEYKSEGFIYNSHLSGCYCSWINVDLEKAKVEERGNWCISRFNINKKDYVDSVLSMINVENVN